MDINNVVITGRLTADPELKYTQSGKAVCKINLAVGRMKKNETDFIKCMAWEKTAEIIAEYCLKGSQVGIVGRIQTGSYEKEDKSKVYTTDILITQVQLLGSKKVDSTNNENNTKEKSNNTDDEFPF